MDIGFGAPVSGAWATPQNLAAFAAGAERGGYRSLWSFQRLLVPAGSGMDPVYQSVLDPMAALSFAAAVTSVIRLGVAIINLPFVSPGYLAKQAATVDVLSGGRHDLGLGIGWLPEEFALTGADMARRGARTEEYVRALRTLWAGADGSFDGSFYQVPAGTQAPPPVQAGGPPVLLGGLARPADRDRQGIRCGGWPRSRRAAGHLPRCRARGRSGSRAGRAAAAALRQLRADPGRHRTSGGARRDRAVLRPQLGSGNRLAGYRSRRSDRPS